MRLKNMKSIELGQGAYKDQNPPRKLQILGDFEYLEISAPDRHAKNLRGRKRVSVLGKISK